MLLSLFSAFPSLDSQMIPALFSLLDVYAAVLLVRIGRRKPVLYPIKRLAGEGEDIDPIESWKLAAM